MKLRNLLALGAAATGGAWLIARHREIRRALPELRSPALYILPFRSVTNERKLKLRRRASIPTVPVAGTDVTRESLGDAEVFVFDRPDRARPSGAVLWIHGGGRVAGSPEEDAAATSALARELGVPVVSVKYRLAPEHPYPAGLDDCMAALDWLHANADRLGVDPERIALAGVSAGGGLAAEVAQRALDEGGPSIAFQGLVFPMLDDRTVLRDNPARRGTLTWPVSANRYAWDVYLGHPVRPDVSDPYVAAARREDLTGLPPAWIGVGELDLFYDEDLDYARRLTEAGVDCELYTVEGMYHGANGIAPDAPSMVDFNQRLIDALRRHIG